MADADTTVTLACSADAGHPDTHTCYHRDRLHEWPAAPDPST